MHVLVLAGLVLFQAVYGSSEGGALSPPRLQPQRRSGQMVTAEPEDVA